MLGIDGRQSVDAQVLQLLPLDDCGAERGRRSLPSPSILGEIARVCSTDPLLTARSKRMSWSA